MSETEKASVQDVCDIYKDLPDYLKGKIDGYAEAIKEKKAIEENNMPQGYWGGRKHGR